MDAKYYVVLFLTLIEYRPMKKEGYENNERFGNKPIRNLGRCKMVDRAQPDPGFFSGPPVDSGRQCLVFGSDDEQGVQSGLQLPAAPFDSKKPGCLI